MSRLDPERMVAETQPKTPASPGLVSVVIPAYNGAPWIEQCVLSVLAQTYRELQIIVVDDGSTDATETILQGMHDARLRVIRQPNRGVAAARNSALQHANGEFAAFLDQDDLWKPEKVSSQVEFLRARPHVVGVYSDAEEFADKCDDKFADKFDERGSSRVSYASLHPGIADVRSLLHAVTGRDVPLLSTFMVRREFLGQHAIQLDVEAPGVDDIGLFLEILSHGGELAYQGLATTLRRMHATNQSADHFNRFRRRIALYEGLLKRGEDRAADWKAVVRRALSDAEFRVGEWHWGRESSAEARLHFQRAWRAWSGNWKAYRGFLYTLVPRRAAANLKNLKRICLKK